jgi:hypothetical protein
MVVSSVIVVEAERRPAEMNESLLVKSEFVETPTELTEKGIAEEVEVAVVAAA